MDERDRTPQEPEATFSAEAEDAAANDAPSTPWEDDLKTKKRSGFLSRLFGRGQTIAPDGAAEPGEEPSPG